LRIRKRIRFKALASKNLPKFMGKLRKAMRSPKKASDFKNPGRGVKSILKSIGCEKDFAGLYVLIKNGRPFYVGISRHVVARLRQHLMGKRHTNATLAFQMARKKWNGEGNRKQIEKRATFKKEFEKAKNTLAKCKVAFIEISDPLTLYVFEVYAAVQLNTLEWNKFETH